MREKIRFIAFVAYPVSDMTRARAFYEEILGLEVTANWENQWVEYDIGEGTLAITNTFSHLQPGAKGALLALELTDLNSVIDELKAKGVELHSGPYDSPACSGGSILDPDGNEIFLHVIKER